MSAATLAGGCVLGELVTNGNFILVSEQKDAWLAQIGFLQSQLLGITGSLFLEFNIPRMDGVGSLELTFRSERRSNSP